MLFLNFRIFPEIKQKQFSLLLNLTVKLSFIKLIECLCRSFKFICFQDILNSCRKNVFFIL